MKAIPYILIATCAVALLALAYRIGYDNGRTATPCVTYSVQSYEEYVSNLKGPRKLNK